MLPPWPGVCWGALSAHGQLPAVAPVPAPTRRPAAAPTAEVVKRAKHEIKRILEETTEKAMRREAPSAGRYSVM